ncbi:hypothetical protein RYJ27_12500 [Microbacterium limosum]|uniref:Uncharacterized protein n=1 Tax=Microbacterium limosum TaxID=3079935 RepID=A0AAU0MHP2_9MICO|nr:hypothetical protein [Microbacterium sp. Y20]WOQ69499.1 hypothetical protein RYJ27_12500 [Microbacterium sp. Y20]
MTTGIVLFGGRAKDLPYPGSTTGSTINGGVTGLVNTLTLELAPIRVNVAVNLYVDRGTGVI